MGNFLTLSKISLLDLYIYRGDYFDGFSFLPQNADGSVIDLSTAVIDAEIVFNGQTLTSFNYRIESTGSVKFWLTNAQTTLLPKRFAGSCVSGIECWNPPYFDNKGQELPIFDIRIIQLIKAGDIGTITVGAGSDKVITTLSPHFLGSQEIVTLTGSGVAGLNAIAYSNPVIESSTAIRLTGTSGVSGTAGSGGILYLTKVDTLCAGRIITTANVSTAL